MIGINNKPFVDLKELIPLDKWKALGLEIKLGLSQAYKSEPIGIPHLYEPNPLDTWQLMIKYECLEEDNKIKIFGKRLKNKDQLIRFLRNVYGGRDHCTYVYLRNFEGEWWKRRYAHYNENTSNMTFFKGVEEFIKELSIFKEIGRVYFFIVNPGSIIPIHADREPFQDHEDHFLWLSDGQKKVYVWDDENRHKYFLPQACYFNHADYHGGDAIKAETYSLKIDGIFKDDIIKLLS